MKQREHIWDIVRGVGIIFVIYVQFIGGWNYIEGKNMENFFLPSWFMVIALVNYYIYHKSVTILSVMLGNNGIQLYYLLVLAQLVLITPLFFRFKNKKVFLFICIGINVVNNIYHIYYYLDNNALMPNNMLLCTCFIAYYAIGLYARNESIAMIKKMSMKFWIVMAILMYGVYVAANYCLLRITGSVLLSTGFVTVGAFLYSMAIIFILLKAEEKIKSDTSIRWLEWLGVHSTEIYLFHWLVEK